MALQRRLAPGDQVRQGTEGPWVPAARVKGLFGADESAGATSSSRELPVAEIDRGIAELEAEEKRPGQPEKDPGDDTQSIFDDYPELRGDKEGADKDFSVEGKPDDSQPAADEKDR